jgi:hypothetical protein
LLLDQLEIAAGALHESAHWVNEIDLNRRESLKKINQSLMAIYAHRDTIFQECPELAPPTPDRLWSDVDKPHERNDVLYRLFDQLCFADEVLRDAAVRVSALGLHPGVGKYTMASTLDRTTAMKQAVSLELDQLREAKARTEADEPVEPQNRSEMLGRLDQDLALASRVLNDCAGLFRDLDLKPADNIRTVADCLATISDIQWQTYQERPDLVPDFLRDAFERQQREQADSA